MQCTVYKIVHLHLTYKWFTAAKTFLSCLENPLIIKTNLLIEYLLLPAIRPIMSLIFISIVIFCGFFLKNRFSNWKNSIQYKWEKILERLHVNFNLSSTNIYAIWKLQSRASGKALRKSVVMFMRLAQH